MKPISKSKLGKIKVYSTSDEDLERLAVGLIKNNPSIFNIYPNPSLHCIEPKWYCKFLFWMKHGEWKIRTKPVKLKDLKP